MSTGLPRLGECRTCHDPIRFVRLDSGKAMPVNPQPTRTGEGNVAALLVGGELHGFVISRDKQPGPRDTFRFRPHYATCPARARPPRPNSPPPEADTPLF